MNVDDKYDELLRKVQLLEKENQQLKKQLLAQDKSAKILPQEFVNHLFDDISVGLSFIHNGKVVYINEATKRILGISSIEEFNFSITELVIPEDRERIGKIIAQSREDKIDLRELEFGIINKQNNQFYIHNFYSQLFVNEDNIYRCIITFDNSEVKIQELIFKNFKKSYEQLLSSLPDIIISGRIDENGNNTFGFISDGILKLTGQAKNYFSGCRFWWENIIDERDKNRVVQIFEQSFGGPYKSFKVEYRIIRTNDDIRWVQERQIIQRTKEEIKYTGIITDITERKKAEETLYESKENLITTLNSIRDAVIATDNKGRITRMNPVAEELIGLTYQECHLRDVNEVLHFLNPKTEEPVKNPVKEILSKPQLKEMSENAELISNNGKKYLVIYNTSTIKKESGELIGAVLVIKDFTIRYKMEEALRESEESFRKIFEESPLGIIIIDLKGIPIRINKKIEQILGFSSEEMHMVNFTKISHPDDVARDRKLFKSLLSGISDTIAFEKRYFHKTREIVWTNVSISLIRDNNNKPKFAIGIVEDITQRKKIEQQLIENETRLKLALEGANEGLWDWNVNTGKVYYSPEWAKMLEYDQTEIQQINIWHIIHPNDIKQVRAELLRHLKGKTTHFEIEHRLRKKNGEYIWILDKGKVVEWDSKKHPIRLAGTHVDITKIKEFEIALIESEEKLKQQNEEIQVQNEELEESNQRYQSLNNTLKESQDKLMRILDSSPNTIIVTDMRGYINECNETAVKLFEQNSKQDIIEKNIFDFFADADRTIAKEILETIIYKNIIRHIRLALKAAKGKLITIEFAAGLIYDIYNSPQSIIFIIEDISYKIKTEELRKNIEIAQRSAQVKQQFLANMSHEIRTPMTGVLGMLEILLQTPLNETQRDYLLTIQNSSKSLLNILNDILDFSKIEAGKIELKLQPFDIQNMFKDINTLFDAIARQKELEIILQIYPDIPTVINADKYRIMQITNNLVSNAIKFSSKGKIEIKVNAEKNTDNIFKYRIDVIDLGIGISKENQKKLFTPFSQVDNTNSRTFDGTGLGLAISRELVQLMKGEIGVISELNKGSNFWFTFEAQVAEQTKTVVEVKDTDVERDFKFNMHVLLVEDKFVNQKVVTLMLKNMGCTVDVADNGKLALDLFKEGKFDIIFMDIQMPVMDGITAVKHLRSNFKKLPPIICLSADAMEGDAERYIAMGMDDYLSKPITQEMLQQKIKKWMK